MPPLIQKGLAFDIGADAESGLVHSIVGTAANVGDVTQAGALLHGDETNAFGDAGYRGVDKREEAQGPRWHVAMQPGKRRKLDPGIAISLLRRAQRVFHSCLASSNRETSEPMSGSSKAPASGSTPNRSRNHVDLRAR